MLYKYSSVFGSRLASCIHTDELTHTHEWMPTDFEHEKQKQQHLNAQRSMNPNDADEIYIEIVRRMHFSMLDAIETRVVYGSKFKVEWE